MKHASRRRRFFRNVVVELECGHRFEATTSFYRLTKARAVVIAGEVQDRHVTCDTCGASGQMLARFVGTCRGEESS